MKRPKPVDRGHITENNGLALLTANGDRYPLQAISAIERASLSVRLSLSAYCDPTGTYEVTIVSVCNFQTCKTWFISLTDKLTNCKLQESLRQAEFCKFITVFTTAPFLALSLVTLILLQPTNLSLLDPFKCHRPIYS